MSGLELWSSRLAKDQLHRPELVDLAHRFAGRHLRHDQVEAMTLADRICVLRDGMIEQLGTPVELYENRRSLFVAGFVGSPRMNFLNGQLAAPMAPRRSACAPNTSRSGRARGAWTGKVIHSENLGSDSYVYVDIGGGGEPVVVREDGTKRHQPDEPIAIKPRTAGGSLR